MPSLCHLTCVWAHDFWCQKSCATPLMKSLNRSCTQQQRIQILRSTFVFPAIAKFHIHKQKITGSKPLFSLFKADLNKYMATTKSYVNIKAMNTVFLYSSVARCSFIYLFIFCLVDLFVTLTIRMYLRLLSYLFCMYVYNYIYKKKNMDNCIDSKTLRESSRLNQ